MYAHHHQTPYTEDNPYTSDTVLPSLLKRILPQHVQNDINDDLERCGDIIFTSESIFQVSEVCSHSHNLKALRPLSARVAEPKLVQYDHWGRRIDELQTSEGWRGLKAALQEEGIIGIFYERKHKEFSRVHGFMKILLASGDSQVVSSTQC